MKNKNKTPIWEDFIEIGSLVKLEGVTGIFLICKIDDSKTYPKVSALRLMNNQAVEVLFCYLDTTHSRHFE